MSLPSPTDRRETYLNAIATGNSSDLPTPSTREEIYLDYIAKNGGGGGGTSNYEQLSNKPQINGVTLSGNKSADDLNLANKTDITGKADKVTNATSGHLAGLDSNGNLTDSGVSPTEEVTVEGNPVTFDSPFEQDAKSVVVSVKPIQDLHGLPFPYVGGAYKNKLPLTVDGIKAANSGVTWTGNSCVIDDVTFTILTNNGENVTGINIDGTPSENIFHFYIARNITFDSAMKFNWGHVTDWGDDHYICECSDGTNNYSPTNLDGVEIPTGTYNVRFGVASGTNIDNVVLYPMIRLATESDATFAPYSNICPISGIDELEIEVSDGESEPTTTTIPLPSTLYGSEVDVTEGSADDEFGFIDGDSVQDLIDLGASTTSIGSGLFAIYFPNFSTPHDSSVLTPTTDLKCNEISNVVPSEQWEANASGISINNQGHVIFTVKDITTQADMDAWLTANPIQIAYKLATPTTISLTPTDVPLLKGTNVVSTNAEKVAVTYGRSLWQDIDELKTDTEGKLDKSDVADVEGDTASKAYSVNDFMLRADGLYKVTQPIASGASITASNTTKTTIGAVLTALLNA